MTLIPWIRSGATIVCCAASLGVLGCSSGTAGHTSTSATSVDSTTTVWPPLPRTGFVRGRAATRADAQAGNAVFVASVGEQIVGQPIDIVIPQYAWCVNETTGVREGAIVVQAEHAQGIDMVGIVMVSNGVKMVVTLRDLELLGQSAPKATR